MQSEGGEVVRAPPFSLKLAYWLRRGVKVLLPSSLFISKFKSQIVVVHALLQTVSAFAMFLGDSSGAYLLVLLSI